MRTVYINANVHTMDASQRTAQAFVVEDNRFAFVGSDEQVRAYLARTGAADKTVDLGGQLVIPGMNDSHLHFVSYAESQSSAALAGARSLREVLDRIAAHAVEHPPVHGAWLQGEGWNNDYFEDENRFPNRTDLDAISTEFPIVATRACIHVASLNTPALALAGITKETAPSFGNLIEVDENGEPNGVIKESLIEEINKVKAQHTVASLKELILSAQGELARQGITSIHSDDFGAMADYQYQLAMDAFEQLDREGRLNVRISEQCRLKDLDQLAEFAAKYPRGYGKRFRINSIKSFTDGSLGARTALLRAPYADDPSTRGIEMQTQNELNALVEAADRAGYPVAVHAIGDGAAEMVLNSIERVRKTGSTLRHGIVHCQITDAAMLQRIADLDVITYIQPIFIDYDMNIVESRVGSALAQSSYAWKTMIDLGIPASYGTDCPVESFRTMDTIYTAVTRTNITGDAQRTYLPEQAVTMEQAIHAYTVMGAYASDEENEKGQIRAGMLADFVTIDRDLFTLDDPREILSARVTATYLDGTQIYAAQ